MPFDAGCDDEVHCRGWAESSLRSRSQSGFGHVGKKSEAQTVNSDGTILLSGTMRAYANIEESAEFVGAFRYARIWNPSALPLEHDPEADAEIGKALDEKGF